MPPSFMDYPLDNRLFFVTVAKKIQSLISTQNDTPKIFLDWGGKKLPQFSTLFHNF